MSDEHRRHPRRLLNYGARILDVNGTARADCTVADISETGAKLVTAQADRLPDQFLLALSVAGRVSRKCQVVWRTGGKVGVRFTG